MKPLHIFRLCAIIIVSLLLVSFIYPKNGITILGYHLDFASFSDFFSNEEVKYADISSIISDTASVDEKEENVAIKIDSLAIQHNAASLKLFKKFYSKLSAAKDDGELMRILHYGDSQIEADRISGTLREKLQKKFGGSGVGIVPITEVSNARSNVFIDADNWLREEIIEKHHQLKGNEYGLLGSVYTENDSEKESWIKIKENKQSPELQRNIGHIKILYQGNLNCKIKTDDNNEENVEKESTDTFSVYDLKSNDSVPLNIKLQFVSNKNMQLYGIALDGESGVTVDNVSLRGSSGIDFSKIDSAVLKQQLKEMKTGMIIMQFGVNVVPNIVKDYSYYQKQFSNQLALFRKIAPDVAILVIGVSDMSRKEKGIYVSYPNIEKIRNAMKQAAFANGCAYWDLYEVMGGQNSMPSWVKAKPTLANKDYTHFNNRGAEIVGTKLYNALIDDYDYQLKKKTKNKISAPLISKK
jgi:lysophospholipase L1-like esterase